MSDITVPVEPLRLYWGGALDSIPEPDWLIDEYLPSESLVVLHAEPNVGKSLLTMDWALCVAAGWSWIGHETEPGRVVYLTSEGKHGLRGRVDAWRQSREADYVPQNIAWVIENLALGASDGAFGPDRDRLLRTVSEVRPSLLVIDPLANYFPPGNENDAGDMSAFTALMQDIIGMGSTVVVNHHQTKSTKDLRGSGALRGAADVVYTLHPQWGKLYDPEDLNEVVGRELLASVLVPEKVKDGAKPELMKFVLQEYNVPTKRGTSVALRLRSSASDPLTAAAPGQAVLVQILNEQGGSLPRADLRAEALRRKIKEGSWTKILKNAKDSGRVRETEEGIVELIGNIPPTNVVEGTERKEIE